MDTTPSSVAGEPAYQRAGALDHVSWRLAERADEVARLITAEPARRFAGELQRLDTGVSAEGRLALVRRVPRGPVLASASFNFPVNLVAHNYRADQMPYGRGEGVRVGREGLRSAMDDYTEAGFSY